MNIWKYVLPYSENHNVPVKVAMSRNATLLSADIVGGVATIWAMHPDVSEGLMVTREFYVIPTGQVFNSSGRKFFCTVHDRDRKETWHLFE